MIFAFTKSDLVGSKAIRWALREPVSHVAVVFDEGKRAGFKSGIVFHSHFSGVQFSWFEHFSRTNQAVYTLKPKNLSLQLEEEIFQTVVKNFYGKGYDKRLFAEFCYHALCKRLFGTKLPAKSMVDSKDSFLCTELASRIANELPQFLGWKLPENGLITPYRLYLSMLNSQHIERIPNF
jgi:hypothetical protein